jgi:hypothetical protein
LNGNIRQECLLSYAENCTNSSTKCDSARGLYCPTEINLCNCPVQSEYIFCDCQIGYHWNYTDNICSMKNNSAFRNQLLFLQNSL